MCRPNAIQKFQKGVLSIAAIRPIAAGEEVTVTYADLAEPSFDRRRYLLHQFHFDSRPDVRSQPINSYIVRVSAIP